MFIRLFIALMVLAPVLRASRVKDMSFVSGGRSNQLIGYGIVVGLAGTAILTRSRRCARSPISCNATGSPSTQRRSKPKIPPRS